MRWLTRKQKETTIGAGSTQYVRDPFPTNGELVAAPGRRRTFVDLTPLRASPAFARLWLSTFLTGLGIQLTIVAVGLQIYSITQDTIAVALVGGIALIPATIAGPLAGMIADAFDRRALLMWLAAILFASTAGLLVMTLVDARFLPAGEHVPIWPFYVFTTVGAMATIALGATRSAITPTLLITGDADTVVPTSDTEKLATMMPNATLVVVPGAGHLPQQEQAVIFVAAVIDWFRANEA